MYNNTTLDVLLSVVTRYPIPVGFASKCSICKLSESSEKLKIDDLQPVTHDTFGDEQSISQSFAHI